MAGVTGPAASGVDVPLHFRVLGPGAEALSPAVVRRLFRGQRLSAARRLRLGRDGRILALCGPQVVGLVAYEQSDRELLVLEFGIDTTSECGTCEIAGQLLEAVELACVAGSVPRLVLQPPVGLFDEVLFARGYRQAGGAFPAVRYEKHFA